MTTSQIRHPSKLPVLQKRHPPPATNPKDSNKIGERSSEERRKALKYRLSKKRRIRNDFVLTHKIDLEATSGQNKKGHHLDCFIKPGEPEEEGTVLHAGSFSIKTVLLGHFSLKTYVE